VSNFMDVGLFHQKFGIANVYFNTPGPRECSDELLQFREDFMQEELDEYRLARQQGDQAKMFDALLDLAYVAMGTAHVQGFPWQQGWNAVQNANMQKVRARLDGSDSKRLSNFDIVKPEGWTAPDIEAILKDNGWAL
jgi:predicted HAD superfamily Cof-like phosphohydrolase